MPLEQIAVAALDLRCARKEGEEISRVLRESASNRAGSELPHWDPRLRVGIVDSKRVGF
jgi:hypothetical protein